MTLDDIRDLIIDARSATDANRALLVGVSGIDASGKGYVSRLLAESLERSGLRAALINVDGWLNLPSVRFSDQNPGEHFYHHALRLEEMFSRLISPLRRDRSVYVTMDHVEETATEFHPHTYAFRDIDVILVEGIFIFKRQFADAFDLKIWIECDLDVALDRAVERGQEGLSSEATIEVYRKIYFPAQRIHFAVDDPKNEADVIYPNEMF